MASSTLVSLPDEILVLVARQLNPASVLALQLTSKRFAQVVSEPFLWREFCNTDFRYWNDKQEFLAWLSSPTAQSQPGSISVDWRSLYATRRTNFKSVQCTIQELVEDPIARGNRIQAIVDGGYQTKDGLAYALNSDPASATYLAQRYWSWVTLGCLHRTRALEEWRKLLDQGDIDNPTERALAALDMFILDSARPGDIDDVLDRLHSYAQSVREARPDIDEQSPQQKAITIASYLREMNWVGIDQGRAYYNLDHMFLGVALHSSHRNSLPLISAIIYSYVCREFGLQAQPCSFPLHVHCIVRPPAGQDLNGNDILGCAAEDITPDKLNLYMDPYNTSEPVSLSALQQQLRFMDSAVPINQLDLALEPASHRVLLIRTVNNIINSITTRLSTHTHPIDVDSAIYGARFALAMYPAHQATQRTNLKDLTQIFLHSFDQDTHIFRNYILPLTTSLPDFPAYRSLSAQLLAADLEKPAVKIRPAPSTAALSLRIQVLYKVGQVFRHRRRGYLAVIYGWDPTCEMSTQWISDNGVDNLPRGRYQPFYNSFVAHDKSTRYVAQENILLCHTGRSQAQTKPKPEASKSSSISATAGGSRIKAEELTSTTAATTTTIDTNTNNNTTIHSPQHNQEEDNNQGDGEDENENENQDESRWQIISPEDVASFGIMVGKWFRRFDHDTGVFVSNVRDEYPDD